MTNGDHKLTKDSKDFVYYDGVRLGVRYVRGSLEFVVKHPGDQARLGCKRVRIPPARFDALEAQPAAAAQRRRKGAKREYRAMERVAGGKKLTKKTKV